jgi:hypothetical protein
VRCRRLEFPVIVNRTNVMKDTKLLKNVYWGQPISYSTLELGVGLQEKLGGPLRSALGQKQTFEPGS